MMDPDKFQMRDMKRRLTKLEDQISYLKTDLKRQTQRVNAQLSLLQQFEEVLPILVRLKEQAS